MDDFNIDVKSKTLGYDKLNKFWDPFNLTNSENHKSLIDLFLTNTPLSFQKTRVF